jgi:hypothetical protein
LHDADAATKRRYFEAFDLQVVYDKAGTVQVSAIITDAVAGLLAAPSALRTESHGGGRIRTCEGRANAFTARPL